jgi:hypothetical protein
VKIAGQIGSLSLALYELFDTNLAVKRYDTFRALTGTFDQVKVHDMNEAAFIQKLK